MGQASLGYFLGFIGFLILLFIAGIVLFVFQYHKRKLLHIRETQLLNEQHKQELLSAQLEIQTQTMQHIGREIHDNVGQKLTLASLYIQQVVYENNPLQATGKIEITGNIINESLAELRQLSKSLTDDTINSHSLTGLIEIECARVNKLRQCSVSFECNGPDIILSYRVKNILLRIVQEFLQNSIKHADCKNIFVNIKTEGEILQLNLQDDGKGFDILQAEGKGIGLINIKKRTELIKGVSSLKSNTGGGTQLHIKIPLQ